MVRNEKLRTSKIWLKMICTLWYNTNSRKPNTNKVSKIKSQPVIEATIEVFNFSKRFQINSLKGYPLPASFLILLKDAHDK
jgi:hypothetical protein